MRGEIARTPSVTFGATSPKVGGFTEGGARKTFFPVCGRTSPRREGFMCSDLWDYGSVVLSWFGAGRMVCASALTSGMTAAA